MGGNALNFVTERKTTEQFNEIFSKIEPILIGLGIDYFLTKSFRNKPTHGDMDILIKNDNLPKEKLLGIIIEQFNPTSLSPNDRTISFDYDQFQIDFILIDNDSWDIAKVWYSYDPFSNVVGKTCHKFRLKYGPNGLIFPFRGINDTLNDNIIISKDAKKIFEFLNYDYERFTQGFDDIEEIFDFIFTSKYFNSEVFQFDNLNRIDRKRNRRRKSYNEFLVYIADNNIDKNYQFLEDRDQYIQIINDFFPESNLIGRIEELKENDRINTVIKEKFNGKLIMNIHPELKGKELGFYIEEFKKCVENFERYILSWNEEDIMNDFSKFYENKKGSI